MVKRLKVGDYHGAVNEFDVYTSNGKYVNGLEKRRKAEQKIYLNADYSGRP